MLQLGEFFLAIYTFDNGVCIYGLDDEVIFIMTIYHYGQNSVTVLAGVGQEIIKLHVPLMTIRIVSVLYVHVLSNPILY